MMDGARATLDDEDAGRRIKDMSAEERRIYNRAVKQRSRAAAAARAKNGKLPRTKEAFQELLALAAASAIHEHPDLREALTDVLAGLLGGQANSGLKAEVLLRCRRLMTKEP